MLGSDSWALKAIEREADRRADQRLMSDPHRLRMFGMDPETILALRNYFLARNAVADHELTAEFIRSRSVEQELLDARG